MQTIYEIMSHNYWHHIREKGTATMLHPLYNQGQYDEPYAFALRYHETDVVIAYPDGSVQISSGGYHKPHHAWSNKTMTVSPTTQERINRYMPSGCRVFQRKYVWYVVLPGGREVEFTDGMVINPAQEANPASSLQPLHIATQEISYN